jgi:hypothetical protein
MDRGTVRFTRLQALLNAPVDQLSEADLQRAVAEQIEENIDLDFKQALYSKDKKQDLATDTAAMANAQGGIIILGISETNARATRLHPLPLNDAEDRRMRQIIAGNVAPTPEVTIRHVPSAADPASGYYVLMIPKSANAPHSVLIDQYTLRYPRRYGTQTLYLAEAEIADAYRNRFFQVADQIAGLEQIHRDGIDQLRPPEASTPARSVWLTLAMVANSPGMMDLRQDMLPMFEQWVKSGETYFDTPFGGLAIVASTGVRRIRIDRSYEDSAMPRGAYGEFYVDGSVFIAVELFDAKPDNDQLDVSDEALVMSMVALLRLATDHAATHTSAYGDAVVHASLLSTNPQSPQPAPKVALVQNRALGFWDQIGRTRPLTRLPSSRHTINIDGPVDSAPERLVAARLILTDLVQAFGLAEVFQINATGALRSRYWRTPVDQWATAASATIVPTTLDQETPRSV